MQKVDREHYTKFVGLARENTCNTVYPMSIAESFQEGDIYTDHAFEARSEATSLVNYPIDSPVSGGDTQDRPMIAWIFENEEYTDLYHTYFDEFIGTYFESGYFEEMMKDVSEMIAPYVEKDPTKFCTYEEFEKGISTLQEFCLLRAKSIRGQLDGKIGSTSDTQNSENLIDAKELTISDMGSMGMGMNGPMGNSPKGGKMEHPMKNAEHTKDMSPDRPMGNRESAFR